jgi:hypothetical protein
MMLNNKFINGPLNIIRLESTIDNIKKSVYICMYYFYDENTKCKNINAIDFHIFLHNLLNKNTNINYDIFIESYNDKNFLKHDKYKKKNYFDELDKFAYFDFLMKKNNVNKSSIFKNLRVHHLSFLDFNYVYNILLKIKTHIHNHHILKLNFFEYLKKKYNEIYNYLINVKNDIKNNNNAKDFMIKMINKILFKYNNKQNNDKMIDIVHEMCIIKIFELIDNIKLHINEINEIMQNDLNHDIFIKKIKILTTIENENTYDAYDSIYMHINQYLTSTFNNINDLYFDIVYMIMNLYIIRRIIDKIYINNSICFLSAYDSTILIYILCKYLNFNVTHTNYINNIDNKINIYDEFTSYVKNMAFYDSYNIKKMIYPTELIQCIDLSKFPDDFL